MWYHIIIKQEGKKQGGNWKENYCRKMLNNRNVRGKTSYIIIYIWKCTTTESEPYFLPRAGISVLESVREIRDKDRD